MNTATKTLERRIHSPADPGAHCAALGELMKSPPFVPALLEQRGVVDVEAARKYFLAPLHDCHAATELLHLEETVNVLLELRSSGEKIVIHGDYDVDGITGTALLQLGLQACGLNVDWFVPSRFADGYGITKGSIDKIREKSAKWIMSVDTGISAVDEVAYAKSHGIGVLITDHHQPPPIPPDADFIVNPNQAGCPYPNKGLSGVGVAYKIVDELHRRLFGRGAEQWLYLVALGTLADSMPLTGENRALVRNGLRAMAGSVNPGITALLAKAGLQPREIGSTDILFRVTPLINAVGRMGSPEIALRLLLARDPQTARELSQTLAEENLRRRELDQEITRQAIAMVEGNTDWIEAPALVLAARDWHEGVVGIVAARLVERFQRPVLVMAVDGGGMAKGSGRSIEGLNLHAALTEVSELFDKWGGHSQACGFSIREESIPLLRGRLNEVLVEKSLAIGEGQEIRPHSRLPLDSLDEDAMTWLRRFEPFGQDNELPLFCCEGIVLADAPRIVGDKHLKLTVQYKSHIFDAIGFGLGRLQGMLDTRPGPWRMAFHPEWNTFRGKRSIQLRVVAVEECE